MTILWAFEEKLSKQFLVSPKIGHLKNLIWASLAELSQDVVLAKDSRDEKSRRDDWKFPEGSPQRFHPWIFRLDTFFSRPYGT